MLAGGLLLPGCGDRRDAAPASASGASAAPSASVAASAATPSASGSASRALATAAAAANIPPGSLLIPVIGVSASALTDQFDDVRGSERHEAVDIMAPRGTPVVAVADGRIVKLFTSKAGGLTVYQFDVTGSLAYYYAHLDRYADGLSEGAIVKRGAPIGFVGSTGNASPDAPHLHFAVFALGPERQWWKGTAVNPFALLTGKQSTTLTMAGPHR